jgi:hypothetical protein
MLQKTKYDGYVTEPSDKPESYYFLLMKKVSDNKRISQKERIFIELYKATNPIPRPFFHTQMRPAICVIGKPIFELREMGFIVDIDGENVGSEKHTTYELIKNMVYKESQPKKRKKWLGLF